MRAIRRPRCDSRRVREVICGDGIAFLANRLPDDHALITSLPDVSEMGMTLPVWRDWFVETVALGCRAIGDASVAIFYQTDIKHDGAWIDKGHLVHTRFDRAGMRLLWHKIVCRVAAGHTTFGRPAYAHVLCASRALKLDPGASTPDVLPELGEMSWSRAMGRAACTMAIDFVIAQTKCTTIVDPFCGHGSILAAANAKGLSAIGVELSKRRAAKARLLR